LDIDLDTDDGDGIDLWVGGGAPRGSVLNNVMAGKQPGAFPP